jgi:hypothetical protein
MKYLYLFAEWVLSLFEKKKDWECYEYWRPNIPPSGCTEQCKECKNIELTRKFLKSTEKYGK